MAELQSPAKAKIIACLGCQRIVGASHTKGNTRDGNLQICERECNVAQLQIARRFSTICMPCLIHGCDEILYYQRMIIVLTKTITRMEKFDDVISP